MAKGINRQHELMILALAAFQAEMIDHAHAQDNASMETFIEAFCLDFAGFAKEFKLKSQLSVTPIGMKITTRK